MPKRLRLLGFALQCNERFRITAKLQIQHFDRNVRTAIGGFELAQVERLVDGPHAAHTKTFLEHEAPVESVTHLLDLIRVRDHEIIARAERIGKPVVRRAVKPVVKRTAAASVVATRLAKSAGESLRHPRHDSPATPALSADALPHTGRLAAASWLVLREVFRGGARAMCRRRTTRYRRVLETHHAMHHCFGRFG